MALVINQYVRTEILTTEGSSLHTFGFNASYLRLGNRSAGIVYANFASTVATTGDFQLESSGTIQPGNILIPSVALLTTSTGAAITLIALLKL